jgi:glycosyltransferase involved in cell wall biosynthesis
VLAQALAAARPVVAYNCDGTKEICLDNETGFLLRPGDLPGLTARLLQLAGDPALRRRLGKNGQNLVKEQFGLEKMIEQLYNLYVELARARQIPAT